MSSGGPGRFGDENRKRREAFIQHNGLIVGYAKYLSHQARTREGMVVIVGIVAILFVVLFVL